MFVVALYLDADGLKKRSISSNSVHTYASNTLITNSLLHSVPIITLHNAVFVCNTFPPNRLIFIEVVCRMSVSGDSTSRIYVLVLPPCLIYQFYLTIFLLSLNLLLLLKSLFAYMTLPLILDCGDLYPQRFGPNGKRRAPPFSRISQGESIL